MTKTLKSRLPAAEICRRNGWGPGTKLVGNEGYGPTVIEITAVGTEAILARGLTHNGKKFRSVESVWGLDCRDWKVALP